MKKIISLSIAILFTCCVFAQNNANLVLEKSFAVVNEYLSAAFLVNNVQLDCTAHLIMKDNMGNVISEMPANLQGGKAEFKIFIPPSIKQGWYHFYAFTKSSTSNDFIELSQISIPIYELGRAVDEQYATTKVPEEFVQCDTTQEPELTFYRSSQINIINEQIGAMSVDKSKELAQEKSKTYQILLELEGDAHLKNFNAFYDFNFGKMNALRKIKGNTYSLQVPSYQDAISGQAVSVDAFGKLELLKAELASSTYDLPEFEPKGDELPYSQEIQEYIVRHTKRLKIINLYDQSFSQPIAASEEKPVDVEFFTKDYIQFNNVIEFINEVLQVVKYNERKAKFSVLSSEKKFLSDPPLLILDDRIVLEPNDLVGIDYKDVSSIEVVRSKEILRNYYSIFGKNGVVILKSKLNSTKYQSYDFLWNDHNKINYVLEENGGPNFFESGSSSIVHKNARPPNADLIQGWYLSNNVWTSKVCKVEMDQ